MKKFFVVGLISFVGSFSNAQLDLDPLAVEVCLSQKYLNDQNECLQQIEGKQYDSFVIDICASQRYPNDKRNCLGLISDKRFLESVEVDVCRQKRYDSEKRECIQGLSTSPF
jgi:hypothetical protein